MYYESYFRIDVASRTELAGLLPQILFTTRSLFQIAGSEVPIRVKSLQLSSLLVG
jgi:hypothetical protein